jgi:hypothetical protein
VIQSTISGSVFEIRTTSLWEPSASKIPARNPLHHSGRGPRGHWMSSAITETLSRMPVLIARIERLPRVGKATSCSTTPRSSSR